MKYVKRILKKKTYRCIYIKLCKILSLPNQKETPKKFHHSAKDASSCGLCGSVEDKTHSKNLFKNNNRELLHLARSLSGEQLLPHENLPELICRPCERRLGNFKTFCSKVQESKKKLSNSARDVWKFLRLWFLLLKLLDS